MDSKASYKDLMVSVYSATSPKNHSVDTTECSVFLSSNTKDEKGGGGRLLHILRKIKRSFRKSRKKENLSQRSNHQNHSPRRITINSYFTFHG